MVPYPSVVIGGRTSRLYSYAYVGIDSKIVQSVRSRELRSLIDYRSANASFTFDAPDQCSGIGLLLTDGTAIVWSTKLPPMEIVVEEAA